MTLSLTTPDTYASALRSWLLAAKMAVEQRGVDADRLLKEAGLDLSTVADPMARYPAHQGLAFWQKAVHEIGEELIGIDVALQFVPLNFNALSYALMASENLAQMYLRLARYAHIITDAADVRFTIDGGAGRLSFMGDPVLLATVDNLTRWSIFDYALLALVRGSRMLYGREFQPLEIRMQRQRPADHAKLERVFRCTPIYGCEDNAIIVDTDYAGKTALVREPGSGQGQRRRDGPLPLRLGRAGPGRPALGRAQGTAAQRRAPPGRCGRAHEHDAAHPAAPAGRGRHVLSRCAQ
ncbi:MAG: AraC family transcriptional regulator [Aquabacterium sp.]